MQASQRGALFLLTVMRFSDLSPVRSSSVLGGDGLSPRSRRPESRALSRDFSFSIVGGEGRGGSEAEGERGSAAGEALRADRGLSTSVAGRPGPGDSLRLSFPGSVLMDCGRPSARRRRGRLTEEARTNTRSR